MTSARPDVAHEAAVFARYLLDADCPPELAERYALALRSRSPSHPPAHAPGERVHAFALTHPWSLPYIASAAAFLADGAVLRSRLTLMTAILEASPRFAPEFLPRDMPLAPLLATLAGNAVLGALRTIVGVPLLLVARFAR